VEAPRTACQPTGPPKAAVHAEASVCCSGELCVCQLVFASRVPGRICRRPWPSCEDAQAESHLPLFFLRPRGLNLCVAQHQRTFLFLFPSRPGPGRRWCGGGAEAGEANTNSQQQQQPLVVAALYLYL